MHSVKGSKGFLVMTHGFAIPGMINHEIVDIIHG